jgi:hypothetical protein
MIRIQRLITAWAVASAATLAAGQSSAGAEEQAAAEALFQQALRLMREEKFAEACPKLVDSNRIEPAVGTLLYLGECYEKSGQTASAWATFCAAAESAHRIGQAERGRIAAERADALAPRLPKISVAVADSAHLPGLELKRDHVVVGEATWGVAVPVDPGEHVITASAPGKKDWSQKVIVEPRGATVAVRIPVLEDSSPARGHLPNSAVAGRVSQPRIVEITTTEAVPPNSGNTQRSLAYVASGIGVLGLALGTSFGLEAKSKQNTAQDGGHCRRDDATACDQTGVDLMHSGHTYATVANVGFVVGALGLIGGTVLFLTAPVSRENATPSAGLQYSTRRLAIVPAVSSRSSSLWVTGAF